MTLHSPQARIAVAGLAALAVFGLIFSIGHAFGVWPGPPLGGFAGTDLVAGLLFGVVLLIVLVRGRG